MSMCAYAKQYGNLKLKFRKNKSYHQKQTAHWYIVTSLMLKPLKRRLIDTTSFRLSKLHCSQYFRFSWTSNFGSVFPKSFES